MLVEQVSLPPTCHFLRSPCWEPLPTVSGPRTQHTCPHRSLAACHQKNLLGMVAPKPTSASEQWPREHVAGRAAAASWGSLGHRSPCYCSPACPGAERPGTPQWEQLTLQRGIEGLVGVPQLFLLLVLGQDVCAALLLLQGPLAAGTPVLLAPFPGPEREGQRAELGVPCERRPTSLGPRARTCIQSPSSLAPGPWLGLSGHRSQSSRGCAPLAPRTSPPGTRST